MTGEICHKHIWGHLKLHLNRQTKSKCIKLNLNPSFSPLLIPSAPTQVKRRPLSAVGYKRPISQYAQMAVATATGAPCRYQVSARTVWLKKKRDVTQRPQPSFFPGGCEDGCSHGNHSQFHLNATEPSILLHHRSFAMEVNRFLCLLI